MAMIALGVCGGIGAYKSVEVVRGLQKQGHDVVAVMTRSARQFVGRADLRGDHPAPRAHRASSSPARTPTSSTSRSRRASTCCWSRRRRPTSSASSPNGIADDFLTSLYLATQGARADGAGDEHPHARARRRAAEPRRAGGARRPVRRSRARAIWPAAGSAKAGSPSPPTSSRAAEQVLAPSGPLQRQDASS